MKKLTRDLKKHYRGVERDIREFDIDLSDESWYNGWHTHLDFSGFSDISLKHRKTHIKYYLELLGKVEKIIMNNKKEFQTWIFIDGKWGGYDALFFHTQNPHTDFPMKMENIEFNFNVPTYLNEVDKVKYRMGKVINEYKDNETNEIKQDFSYIIQKIGLGVMI